MFKFFKQLARKRHLRNLQNAIDNVKEFNIIYDTFIWDIISFLRKQGRFLERLFNWIPVLYRDEDWDYEHLLNIMDFKLSRIQKVLEQDDVHADIKQTLTKMKLIRGSFDRYKNSEKYLGEPPETGELKFEKIPDSEYYTLIDNNTEDYKKYLDLSYEYEAKNYRRFFDYLKKYLHHLWT